MKLTHGSAKDALPGVTLDCDQVKGLSLRCGPNTKSWMLYYRTKGKQRRRPKIGAYPTLNVTAARELAREILGQVARGEDPKGDWNAERDAPTVSHLCDKYLVFAKQNVKAKTYIGYAQIVETQIRPGLGKMRVRDVTLSEIETFLDAVEARKFIRPENNIRWRDKAASPGTRNRVRSSLSKMFGLAEGRFGMRPRGTNPVPDTIKSKERKRKRLAQVEELPRIAEALAHFRPKYPRRVAAITVMFLSGARVGEIIEVTPRHFRDDRFVWEDHKTDKHGGDDAPDREIRLSPLAQSMVEDALVGVALDKQIFGPYDRHSYTYVWKQVRSRAGCAGLQMLDARRTFASVALTRNDKTLPQVGELLGHSDPRTTARYAWLMEDAGKQSAHEVAGEIEHLMDRDD